MSTQRHKEKNTPAHRRERPQPFGSSFYMFFFSPLGPAVCKLVQPGVLFVLPEVLTLVLRSSFVLFSWAFPSLVFQPLPFWTPVSYSNYLTVGWHHRLNGHEFGQTLGDGEGQGSLICCNPWDLKESGRTEGLNNNNSKRNSQGFFLSLSGRDCFQLKIICIKRGTSWCDTFCYPIEFCDISRKKGAKKKKVKEKKNFKQFTQERIKDKNTISDHSWTSNVYYTDFLQLCIAKT